MNRRRRSRRAKLTAPPSLRGITASTICGWATEVTRPPPGSDGFDESSWQHDGTAWTCTAPVDAATVWQWPARALLATAAG